MEVAPLDIFSQNALVLRYGWCVPGIGWQGGADYGWVARDWCGDCALVRRGWREGSFQLSAGEGAGACTDAAVRGTGSLRGSGAGTEHSQRRVGVGQRCGEGVWTPGYSG